MKFDIYHVVKELLLIVDEDEQHMTNIKPSVKLTSEHIVFMQALK
jgi:hypothetical protein